MQHEVVPVCNNTVPHTHTNAAPVLKWHPVSATVVLVKVTALRINSGYLWIQSKQCSKTRSCWCDCAAIHMFSLKTLFWLFFFAFTWQDNGESLGEMTRRTDLHSQESIQRSLHWALQTWALLSTTLSVRFYSAARLQQIGTKPHCSSEHGSSSIYRVFIYLFYFFLLCLIPSRIVGLFTSLFFPQTYLWWLGGGGGNTMFVYFISLGSGHTSSRTVRYQIGRQPPTNKEPLFTQVGRT